MLSEELEIKTLLLFLTRNLTRLINGINIKFNPGRAREHSV
jgi:hypothetical protein